MKYLLSFFIALTFASSAFAQSVDNNDKPLAPTFKVRTLDGKIFSSPDLKGKTIVLNLWFIGCPHCVEEIKILNAMTLLCWKLITLTAAAEKS